MPKFWVEMQEVHCSLREVEADSVADAIEKADTAPEIDLEYTHTLDGMRVRELPDGEWEVM